MTLQRLFCVPPGPTSVVSGSAVEALAVAVVHVTVDAAVAVVVLEPVVLDPVEHVYSTFVYRV